MKDTNQKGFTLVEVMVSLTIMSFIVLGIYTIVNNNVRIKDRIIADDQEFIQVQTALNRMNMDISEIYSPRYFESVKTQKNQQENNDYNDSASSKYAGSENYPVQSVKFHPIPAFKNEERSRIEFLSNSNRRKIYGQKQGRLNWIQYRLEDNPREGEDVKEGAVLVRRVINESVFNGQSKWEDVKAQPLIEGVKSLKFTFWDKEKERWIEDVDQLSNGDQYSVRAIKVELIWVDHNGVDRETFRIFKPLWPYFDVIADQKALDEARKGETPKNQQDNDQQDDEDNNP